MNENEKKHTEMIDKIIAEVCDLETKRPKEDWENCPLCNNDGIIPEREIDIDPDGNVSEDWFPTQCEFCYTNPKSIFNQKRLLKETGA